MQQATADALIERGAKIGIQKGNEMDDDEKLLQAVRRMVGDLLRRKFGNLSERPEKRLLKMDLAGLKTVALALLSAKSLEDLGL